MTGPRRRKTPPKDLPPVLDWRTSDHDEIARRQLRGKNDRFRISNLTPRFPVFSNFEVRSSSGMSYSVEVRNVRLRQFSCQCTDFKINGLGTCKHVEAVLLFIAGKNRAEFQRALKYDSNRLDVVLDALSGSVRLNTNGRPVPARLSEWFDRDGCLTAGEPGAVIEALNRAGLPSVRISQEIAPWLVSQSAVEEQRHVRQEYERKVQSGAWPVHETKVPLFPYQREGMLHLAFSERGLLADEMGLGKTIQAIAACVLLHRLGRVKRVLIVTPASLKTEWEDQIQRFTDLEYRVLFGASHLRLRAYDHPVFFTIVNYEQMVKDALEVNARLRPDVVILDEAQRIKNWNTKTAQSIKRLQSRFAFVLTGTPIENRIDELYSIISFLNPQTLGPLFRFNRDFYQLDDRGRPAGYQNLDLLKKRIAPLMLRRRKEDVETELPARTDSTRFVPLSAEQKAEYEVHEGQVARLAATARRRPLSKPEQDKLMRELAMMRMVCDTNYILDPTSRTCPKLRELRSLLEELRENPAIKMIVFSEWERMLELVRGLCLELGLGVAWHTGSVPQRRRRAEINLFKSDAACRIFLSTDSGSTGLNLQNASVVVNCDLPWNPARLEQRIARAWRKNQIRPVTVVNLVSENTIEHRMLETLANKQALSEGVLDGKGDLSSIKFRSGCQAFVARLEQILSVPSPVPPPPDQPALPVDRSAGFSREASAVLDGSLVRCEEYYPGNGETPVLLVIVERDAPKWAPKLSKLHEKYFPVREPAETRLQVMDQATDQAIREMIEAGLISTTLRTSRSLFPDNPELHPVRVLSPEDAARVSQLRSQAERKLRMARVLAEAGMAEEARVPAGESWLALSRALSLEHFRPEPASLEEALCPPARIWLKNNATAVAEFLSRKASSWPEALSALSSLQSESGGDPAGSPAGK